MAPSGPRRAAFVFVFITVALDMLALGVIVPVLPKLIVRLEQGDVARAAEVTGYFGTLWAAMQFVFAPVLGAMSDRYGRRPVILLSNLGLGLDYLFMALAPTVPWLFLGRALSGITSASFPTAAAYIADVTPVEKRPAKFGMLGAAFGFGFVVGPAIGGVLGGISLRLPFWAAGALSLINATYGLFVLPESLPVDKRARFDWRKANPVGSFRLLASHPELVGLSIALFLSYLAHEALPGVFVLYTTHRYGWSDAMVGMALTGVGLCSTLVSAALVGPATQRLGARRSVLTGFLFGAAGFATFAIAPQGSLFLVGVPLIALWGIGGPSMQTLMSERVGASAQGQLQGALSSVRGVTGMIGPILFTQTLAAAVRAGGPFDLPGAPYWLAAALLAPAMWLAWRVTRASAGEPSAASIG